MKKIILLLTLSSLPLFSLEFTQIKRTAFIRGERDAHLSIAVKNSSNAIVKKSVALFNGKRITIPEITPNKTIELKLPIESNLFSGEYKVNLTYNNTKKEFVYYIGPQLPDEYPIFLWGFKSNHKILQDMGFNSGIMYRCLEDTPSNWNRLDRAITDGFRYWGSFTTNGDKNLKVDYPVIKKDGKPAVRSVDASHPQVYARMLKLLKTYPLRIHPAVDGALLHSEIRPSGTRPSFTKYQINAWKKHSGKDIPAEVDERIAPHYRQLKNFPSNRVVPDNHHLLEYYKWFWKEGDGWNKLNSNLSFDIKQGANSKFRTFHDPIVRTPPIWGSGGNVDAVNHWTYAYPDPFRITSHIDSMFAMVQGNPRQEVFAMTQLISYRSRITNKKIKLENPPQWAKEFPKAEYISIPPDFLQEAIWTMFARPIKGILFHGEGSMLPRPINKKKLKNYFCTNKETQVAMKKVLTTVVKPLMPTVKQLGEESSKIAILHSFASTILAGRGSWGSGGWIDEVSLLLYRAGYNPKVVYEETILRDGLKDIKVLVMPHCDVLTTSIVKIIKEFQKNGGIVIGDENLCPAIVPQILLTEIGTTSDANKREIRVNKTVNALKKSLKPYVQLGSLTNNNSLIRFVRTWKNTKYYFVINDKREFGSYVGPWKAIKDKGAPNKGKLIIRKKAGVVYELSQGVKTKFTVNNQTTEIPLSFDTNDGRIFLVLDKEIAKISLELPQLVTPGKEFTIKAKILDTTGKPVPAVLPVKFSLTDSKKQSLDKGPYSCAKDGVFTYTSICPVNASGEFTFNITCLTSKLTNQGKVKIGKINQ